MLENVQSPLVKAVSESELMTIMRSSLDSEIDVTHYRPLKGGLFNTSYYISTRNPAYEVVLRIAPPAEMHINLFDYEKTMMQSEPAVYDLMRAKGLPVPEVVSLDVTGNVIPRQFILLKYLDSVPMNDPTVSDEVKAPLQRQLGRYLKQMHNITHEKFGRLKSDGSVDGDVSWRVVFSKLYDEAVQRCREHQLIDTETLAQVEEIFTKYATTLDDHTIRPSLVHGDLWDGNVLIRKNDAMDWKIIAIIDVDRAMFADAEFDATLWYNTPDFLSGYGSRKIDSDDAKIRYKLYHLYQDLFHLFVFGIQIPIPGSMKHHHDSIKKLVQTL